MDPIFTLQWPEFLLASELQKKLPKTEGYSVLVPVSRQEKGIDLALLRKAHKRSRTITIQVKASKTYMPERPKRQNIERFRYLTWFNRFEVPPDADFVVLLCTYPPDDKRTKRVTANWYHHLSLVFDNAEMVRFMDECRNRKGDPDRMFGFGFDDRTRIVLTRGEQHRSGRNYMDHLLEHRLDALRSALS